VEGGSCNDYDYACGDPVNGLDLDGRAVVVHTSWFAINCGFKACTFYLSPKAIAAFRHFVYSLGWDIPKLGQSGVAIALNQICKKADKLPLGDLLVRYLSTAALRASWAE